MVIVGFPRSDQRGRIIWIKRVKDGRVVVMHLDILLTGTTTCIGTVPYLQLDEAPVVFKLKLHEQAESTRCVSGDLGNP